MNKKGFSPVLIVVILAVLVLLGITVYFLVIRQPGSSTPSYSLPTTQQTPTQTEAVPTVKSAQDLNTVVNDLDKTNLDSMDSQLNQNAADAAGF